MGASIRQLQQELGERTEEFLALRQIIEAVRELYKVTPRMVRVVTIPAKLKRNARTGKPGVKHGGKKAYVFLKKGDTIAIR